MNNNKYMVLSTCFTRIIDGHDVDFTLSMDSKGNVRIKPTFPEYVQEFFPNGIAMEIAETGNLIFNSSNK
jgi:hypothetical protein